MEEQPDITIDQESLKKTFVPVESIPSAQSIEEVQSTETSLLGDLVKSVSEGIDSVTKSEPSDNQPSFLDGIMQTVSEGIDAVTKSEPPKDGIPQEGFLDNLMKSISETLAEEPKEGKQDSNPREGFFDGIMKSVTETIDSVTKEEPPKEGQPPQESFFDGLVKSVSDTIDSVTKEEPPQEGQPPKEGFLDGILKSVSETIDSVTKEEPPQEGALPQEGILDGIFKSVSETIESVTREEPKKEGELPEEGFLDGIFKTVSETIDAVTKEQVPTTASRPEEGVFRRLSAGIGSFFEKNSSIATIREINIAILGASATGKTSIVTLFVSGNVLTDYDSTVGKKHLCTLFHYHRRFIPQDCRAYPHSYPGTNHLKFSLQNQDTGGDPQYQKLLPNWLAKRDGYVLVYSITSAESFEYVKTFADKSNLP